MIEFIAALGIFLLSHSIPARPRIRTSLVQSLGLRGYILAYSALSLVLLGWLLSAASRAPFIPVWDLAMWQYYVPIALMLPAFLLFAAGAVCPNPLSVNLSGASFDPQRPGVVALTRHPILWGFALWALAHLFPNGDLVSIIMFGGFGSFALLAMPLIDRRKRRALGVHWDELAAVTTGFPLAHGRPGRRTFKWRRGQLIATLLLGLGLYVAFLWLHPVLIGPDPKIVFG